MARDPHAPINPSPVEVKHNIVQPQPLFGRERRGPPDQVAGDEDLVGELPVDDPARRKHRPLPTVNLDLSERTKVIFLLGRGNTGKTTISRVVAEDAKAAGRSFFVAACDRGTRTLGVHFDNVQMPDGKDDPTTARFINDALVYASKERCNGLIDLGASGEDFVIYLDRRVGGLAEHCERLNIVPVFLHTVATGVNDLSVVKTFQTIGLWPKASAIVLNEMVVPLDSDRYEAFDLILRQSCLRAAVAMGAPQLWLPVLERETFMQIERRQQSFGAAAKGSTGKGSKIDPIGPHDRFVLERWLKDVKHEFSPIMTWLL